MATPEAEVAPPVTQQGANVSDTTPQDVDTPEPQAEEPTAPLDRRAFILLLVQHFSK